MSRRYNKPLHAKGKPPRFPRYKEARKVAAEPAQTTIDFDHRHFHEYSGEENGITWRELYDGSGELTLAHFVADADAYDTLEAFTGQCHFTEVLGYPAPPFPAKPRAFEQSDYGRTACADLRAYFGINVRKSHEAYVVGEEWNDRGYAFELNGQYHFHWWCTSA